VPGGVTTLDRSGYELEFEDTFDAPALDERRWLPYYLPQWSSRERSAARYRLGDGRLTLLVEPDQPPWCPHLDGEVRVSSLQTGLFSGPLGSAVGQHRFHPEAVVREEQPELRLYTPRLGIVEVRAEAIDDPSALVALWMIGFRGRARALRGDLRDGESSATTSSRAACGSGWACIRSATRG
jgi:hypothetical protein